MDADKECARLEQIAGQYDPEEDWEEAKIIRMAARLIIEHAEDKSLALELGTSTGFMTEQLAPSFDRLVSVDGSSLNIEKTRKRLDCAGLTGYDLRVGLFETFEPAEKFPNIIMAHVLEHVEDPGSILNRFKRFLKPGGIFHIVVPNAASLNRRIGFMLGMMEKIDQLGPKDHMVGHRRLYTYETLLEEVQRSGLQPLVCEGIFLKPLAKAQMSHWKENLIDAFFEIGREIPAFSMGIYLAAGLEQGI